MSMADWLWVDSINPLNIHTRSCEPNSDACQENSLLCRMRQQAEVLRSAHRVKMMDMNPLMTTTNM
jgi:hypothetical protein